MTPDERAALRAHLLQAGIAGDTATPRRSVVEHAERLATGDPDKQLGVGPRGRDEVQVMRAVADLCGCSPDLMQREGPGVIDPERTIDGLIALRGALQEVKPGARMLIATGHPTGLLPMYMAISRALTARGVVIETPGEGVILRKERGRHEKLLYLDGVAVLSRWPHLAHCHSPIGMDAMLDAVPAPDLVLADHGFAGAAATRGVPTVCFTDVNDPAIAVAAADGLLRAVVPLDDNLPPGVYGPLTALLTAALER